MSSAIYLHGTLQPVAIKADVSDGVIWLRTFDETLALTLTRQQRAALRDALDEIDAGTVPQEAAA